MILKAVQIGSISLNRIPPKTTFCGGGEDFQRKVV